MSLFSYFKATYLICKSLVRPSMMTRYYEPVERYEIDPTLLERLQYVYSDPIEIIDNIYLGNSLNAANDTTLQKFKINVIINVTDNIPNFYENDYEYYSINIKDTTVSMFGEQLLECAKFMNKKIKEGKNIMVHCFEGRSRSVAILVYYLMMYHEYGFYDAYDLIKNKKKIVNINKSFICELQDTRQRSKSLTLPTNKNIIIKKVKSCENITKLNNNEYIVV